MQITDYGIKLSNKTYNFLKWFCLICLPALAVFYMTIAKIWGLPYGEQVTATINAVALLLGALIGISQRAIKKEGQNENN